MKVYTDAEFHAMPPETQEMLRRNGWSASTPSETAGPAPVVAAVATGSLPVLSAEALCCEWEEKARDYQRLSGPCDEAGKIKFTAIADTFWACAAGLRRQMEATTERQPEENAEVSRGDGSASQPHQKS